MPDATIPELPFEEEWKVIEEFPDYEISSVSEIRRIKPSARGYAKGFFLRPAPRRGRNKVTLHYFGKIGRRVFVDELVATTFICPRPSQSHIVIHKDGDLLNDRLPNVQWGLPLSMQPDGLEWRPIPGFSGYDVREDGVIRRSKPSSNGRTNQIGSIIKAQCFSKYGHLTALLVGDDGLVHGHTVHRLVCLAFHGPKPSPIHQAAHNDGKPSNNHWRNLRWATPQENANDKFLHGTNLAGNRNPRSILSVNDVIAIRRELASDSPRTYGQIGRHYGVSSAAIYYLRHHGWKSVTDEGSH